MHTKSASYTSKKRVKKKVQSAGNHINPRKTKSIQAPPFKTRENTFLELVSKEEKIASLLCEPAMPKNNFNDTTILSSERRKTIKLDPPTPLISKIQEFLPKIAIENKKIQRAEPESVDIEHIEENTKQIIEWELHLGVFEEIRKPSEPIIMDLGALKPGQSKPSIVIMESGKYAPQVSTKNI